MRTLAERLERLSIPEPNTGCVLWLGATHSAGYGKFTVATGRSAKAHRVAYELANGPIPAGLVIDHLCRVRQCINPDHLEAVTQLENVHRGERGTKTHCKKGHPLTVRSIRANGFPQRYCRTCHNGWRKG